MNKEIVLLKKLDKNAIIPTYAHNGDIGLDITAIDIEYNEEFDYYAYHTGLAFANDYEKGILLFPRSSNRKKECYLANSIGLADTAIYRGEIIFTFKNRTSFEVRKMIDKLEWFQQNKTFGDFSRNEQYECKLNPMDFAPYKIGDKIGQMVLVEFPKVEFKIVDELNETVRGENGHGSTGE